jgi:hypothetical protein
MFSRGLSARTGHPPAPESLRPTRIPIAGVVLVLAGAVLLGILFYYAQFSGELRWLLAVVSLAVIAMLAWGAIRRRTAEPTPLVAARSPDVSHGGELESFAAAVRRAARGLPYSQALVASRARSAFAERVRLAFGLSPERMHEMQRDPAALHRLFADDALVDFLRLEAADADERADWVRRARDRGGFVRALRGVLDRMEAWR